MQKQMPAYFLQVRSADITQDEKCGTVENILKSKIVTAKQK